MKKPGKTKNRRKPKKVKLKDRSEVLIRPLEPGDLDSAVAFFKKMPKKDRGYLRRDVRDRAVVEQMFEAVAQGRARRIVAVAEGKIVAEGALELEPHAWKRHMGELRLVVARPFQRKGLGMLMARELYHQAAAAKLEELTVRIMRPQIAARKIFRRLGFRDEVLLQDYVRDLDGAKQDLVFMRCDLGGLWRELEDYFVHGDWQRTR
jgi:L-amino acid N-acyltransferase YncA